MEIYDGQSFVKYLDKVKARTARLFDFIPEDKIEWTYQNEKFTIGDQIRHLAAIERFMYVENVQLKPSKYQGCGIELADGKEAVVQFYLQMQKESRAVFERLTHEDMERKSETPGGVEITVWKWLRALIEHEVHHRGQLYMYLAMLGVDTPPLYGLTSEEVISRSV
ncbi:DinB family protein [Ekhidna sp. MALMAid0563]|uniref:DinB family protein n=1 Tax=Ekhidna sp. MALMAid0563 TaxID=3143937 RepID=UPI0032DFE420